MTTKKKRDELREEILDRLITDVLLDKMHAAAFEEAINAAQSALCDAADKLLEDDATWDRLHDAAHDELLADEEVFDRLCATADELVDHVDLQGDDQNLYDTPFDSVFDAAHERITQSPH